MFPSLVMNRLPLIAINMYTQIHRNIPRYRVRVLERSLSYNSQSPAVQRHPSQMLCPILPLYSSQTVCLPLAPLLCVRHPYHVPCTIISTPCFLLGASRHQSLWTVSVGIFQLGLVGESLRMETGLWEESEGLHVFSLPFPFLFSCVHLTALAFLAQLLSFHWLALLVLCFPHLLGLEGNYAHHYTTNVTCWV